jgi:large subunit ribosomal protein L9
MNKNVKLLLTENVDNLGIVGDVVNVRLGYARNFLLPRGLATQPSEDLIKELAAKRADAQKELAAIRKQREGVISKLDGLELTMVRACNDQGHLYGSVSQQDIATGLKENGYAVKPREVRLPQTIKRLGDFEVLVKFDSDLEASLRLHVVPDRAIDMEAAEEMDFDNEGNLIEPGSKKKKADDGEKGDKPAKKDKAEKAKA